MDSTYIEDKCRACGAPRITSAAAPCWLCGARLPADNRTFSGRRASTIADRPAFVVFGLFFLLLLCYSMVIFIEAPGIGILLGLLALPCLLRTIYVAARQSQRGQPLSGARWFFTLVGYLGVVAFVGLAAFIAFFLTCLAVCAVGGFFR